MFYLQIIFNQEVIQNCIHIYSRCKRSMRIAYFGDQRIDISEYDAYLLMCKESGVEPFLTCAEGHQVIAKRGEKNAHHFAHKSHTSCSCHDNKGNWHISWQDRVVKEAREVRMRGEGNKLHIADICIPRDKVSIPCIHKGYVIELQHSTMDTRTIQERERFYTSQGYILIWIFDCSNDWEYRVVRRCKTTHGEEVTIRRIRGRDFHMNAQYSGNVLKFLDFNKNSLFLVTKQSGPTITGMAISLEDFDTKYLGSYACLDRDMRPFHHPM